ncbi:hypothetical protein GCM10029992_29700 [Glycomyces albus]
MATRAACADAADQAEGEGGEVVADVPLGDLVRAEPEDRQDAEQAEGQPQAHLLGQHEGRHREHADVQSGVGERQIGAAVASEVDTPRQDGDREQVDRQYQGYGESHGFSFGDMDGSAPGYRHTKKLRPLSLSRG